MLADVWFFDVFVNVFFHMVFNSREVDCSVSCCFQDRSKVVP